jgi:hypothetical protein
MKAQRESRGVALLLPRRHLGEGGQPHASAALLPGKKPFTHCLFKVLKLNELQKYTSTYE